MSSFSYFLGEAWTNLRVNRWVTVVSVLTLSLTLLIFGLYLLIYANVAAVTGSLRENVGMTVFLKDDVTVDGADKLSGTIARLDGVAGSGTVSKAQALAQFQKDLGSEVDVTSGLGYNPLPASIEVTITRKAQEETRMGALAKRIENLPGVEEVEYNEEWVQRLNVLLRFLQVVGLAVGLVLGLAGIAIIANTIRLKVYTRREEIEVMKFIGATDGFILIPYLLEGVLLGLLAAAIAVAFLASAFKLFEIAVSNDLAMIWMGLKPVFLSWPGIAALVVAGAVLGGLGSLLSVRRFIQV